MAYPSLKSGPTSGSQAIRLEPQASRVGQRWTTRRLATLAVFVFAAACRLLAAGDQAAAADLTRGLVGHWPLAGDARDISGKGRDAVATGVTWDAAGPTGKPASAGRFDGRSAFLELPAAQAPKLGTGDFALSVWMNSPTTRDDVPGDLVSQYDATRRRGFHLSLKTNAGVTFNQANDRDLQFWIDDNRESGWTDCGRPGDGLLAFGLAVHNRQLFAGVCRPAEGQSGRVYRYAGGKQWLDCGAPDGSNTVTALAAFQNQLYVGTGKYRVAGSALPESENKTLGGRIFRYQAPDRWIDCGALPDREAVAGLVVFRERLYAASLYKPAGFFRYEGGTQWTACAVPVDRRVESLGVYNGHLYATTYDGGRVFRYDGASWTDCGQLGEPGVNTQTYAFAVHQGRLLVGTWPSGRVYRFESPGQWTDLGRLGEELEVMGMLVHHGRLLAGSLPLAEVYQFEPAGGWRKLRQLDTTPDVKYRRAWTMAEFSGRLYCSTLPSGVVWSYQAGQAAATNSELPGGWRHVVAQRQSGRLKLYIDGRPVADAATQPDNSANSNQQSGSTKENNANQPDKSDSSVKAANGADARPFDLTVDQPLRIGRGENDFFHGDLAAVRLYDRALEESEITALVEASQGNPKR